MRDLFDALAGLLATPEGLRTARLLQAAGLLGRASAPEPRPLPRPPEPISIWQPREVDFETADETVWVRPDPQPLGDHFAATKVLRRKKSELPLRVAFFGESVAAGYLYAPHVTPAQVLERQLREIGGESNFEVIDLARTNETLGGLAETVRTSLQINPDVLVLFAGNNWNLLETPEVSPYAPSVLARQRYGQALRDQGIAGPVRQAEERLREIADAAFGAISEIAWTVGVPVVLVIPEVNLIDWETRQPPVWLPGDGTARWHELYAKTIEKLDRGDFHGALEAAQSLKDLDGGACSSTWRLLARAYLGLGDREAARQACLAEIDAARYATLAFLSAPQATTQARELLREAARRHGLIPVDLREVFNLPDRRLFLDYCHLTLEGIHIAMAAVAAEVLNLSGMIDEDQDWQRLLPRLSLPAISPEAEATARFGAAIHTAHRLLPTGSKRPILEHWCEAALDASPGIAETMLDLVAARCAPCPAVLTAAQQRNLASSYRLTLQHGWRWDHLDADLIEAIHAVLERRGHSVGALIDRLLLEHLAIREEGTELLDPIYLWEPLERFYPEVMDFADLTRRATLRSPWPETSFCLICEGERDMEIEATLRLPAAGSIRIAVNDHDLGVVEVRERWTKTAFRIDRKDLRRGLNRLTLRWPLPAADGETALAAAVERLEVGVATDLHPVFGEVFSVVARPAARG
ncbi:MAG: SGNH/GDSL hydrolase family protein [Thermoanaerobaculia bacterium]